MIEWDNVRFRGEKVKKQRIHLIASRTVCAIAARSAGGDNTRNR